MCVCVWPDSLLIAFSHQLVVMQSDTSAFLSQRPVWYEHMEKKIVSLLTTLLIPSVWVFYTKQFPNSLVTNNVSHSLTLSDTT